MIDHVAVNVSDLDAAGRSRTGAGPARVRGRAGLRGRVTRVRRGTGSRASASSAGIPSAARPRRASRRDRHATVDAFHAAALAAGARTTGPGSPTRTTTSTTTAPSCLIRTATTSKPSVRSRSRCRSFGRAFRRGRRCIRRGRPKRAARKAGTRRCARTCTTSGDELVLFDPLAPPPEIHGVADARPVVVLLTCHWHQRSSQELVERLGATVYSSRRRSTTSAPPPQAYSHGDTLPGGVEALDGGYSDEATLWIPACGGLVIGDVFLGGEQGFRVQPDSWLAEGLTHEGLRERLRPLLELPIELLLPTHGEPVVGGRQGRSRARTCDVDSRRALGDADRGAARAP